MPTPRLDDQICFQLHTASRLVIRAYQPVLDGLDLTYLQYLCMLVLWESDETAQPRPSVKELGERLYLDSGTLTPLLKRLGGKGLVTRSRSDVDGRVVLIGLTDAGKALAERADEVPSELLCRIRALALPPEKTQELMNLREQLGELVSVLLAADAKHQAVTEG